jgi:hypothetical protein
MAVAQASVEAYGRMSSVKPKEHPVYKLLKTFGAGSDGYSNRQIAAIMQRPINTITPRVFELRQAGVVVLAGKRKDLYSGIEVSHWRIASEEEENNLKGLKEPAARVWTHLADIPEGVVVCEQDRFGWLWLRRGGGEFGFRDPNDPEDTTFGGWGLLGIQETFYGPVTEVKV